MTDFPNFYSENFLFQFFFEIWNFRQEKICWMRKLFVFNFESKYLLWKGKNEWKSISIAILNRKTYRCQLQVTYEANECVSHKITSFVDSCFLIRKITEKYLWFERYLFFFPTIRLLNLSETQIFNSLFALNLEIKF